MKKSDREKIFNKYGGKCAYCGCPLQKGWHVDEIEPLVRNFKYVRGIGFKPDGCQFPERLHINNQNPACASCNILKSSSSLEHFREKIFGFIKSLNNYTNQYKVAKRYGLISETNIEVKFYFETIETERNNTSISL